MWQCWTHRCSENGPFCHAPVRGCAGRGRGPGDGDMRELDQSEGPQHSSDGAHLVLLSQVLVPSSCFTLARAGCNLGPISEMR